MLSARPISHIHENNDYSRITASKTPGRALKGRAGLQENMLHDGSVTANPKEKRVALQTPFRQGINKIALQDAPASTKTATFANARPLGDKTPKPNRQSLSLFTPGQRKAQPGKFTLPALLDEPGVISPTQPPSSSRKTLRSPRISKNFETPITKGDHWNVSDVSIEEEISFLEGSDANRTDDSDPEYMPPKPVELPYEPPFELPDYKEVGRILRTLAYSYPAYDTPYVYQFDSEDLLKGCEWSAENMQLNAQEYDEDEIFGPRKPKSKANTRMPASSSTSMQWPVSRLTRMPSAVRGGSSVAYPPRPATSVATRAPDPRSVSIPSRPGTSTSKSRPVPPRATIRSSNRTTSFTKAKAHRRDNEDTLALQFGAELEIDDDFRFTV